MKNRKNDVLYVGVDVSEDTLDVYRPDTGERGKIKGHAQQLRWTQRNSASNTKTIGDRTAADGEFALSTTVKASKDETSHE